jgi:hypothetical protein
MNEHEQPSPETFDLSRYVLEMVSRDGDRHFLEGDSARAFQQGIDLVFETDGLSPKIELERVLRLGSLFETELDGCGVAGAIVEALSRDERCLAALGISAGRKTREAQKQFAKLAGAELKLVGPKYDENAPDGTVKLSTFLDPVKEMRRTSRPSRSKP